MVVPGRVIFAGAGMSVSIVYFPLARAAESVTILNVDPGGYVSASERFSNGLSGSASSVAQALRSVAVSVLASGVGSNEGLFTIARMAPVEGWIAMTAPFLPAICAIAAACAFGLIVSRMLPPFTARPATRSESR